MVRFNSISAFQCFSMFFADRFFRFVAGLFVLLLTKVYNSSHVSVDIEVRSCRRAHPTSMGEHEEVAREEE